MRDAETTLAIIHARGKDGLPLEDIYRRLYNPALYLRAYENLRNNAGAMTPGVTGETVDGMSLEKIKNIIEDVRLERFRWSPARRVYIPKKNGKMRPLGMPTWRDKLLQEVMRQILEAYYEPQFSAYSHGFRPKRGCHTALTAIHRNWNGTHWLIEGDISQCFDRLDHDTLLAIMAEKLHDNRFLRLVATMLKAGYLEEWTYNETLSGTPQGGVISPILSNIYLDRLDKYVEGVLLPRHNAGLRREHNRAYDETANALKRARGQRDSKRIRELRKQLRGLPYGNPDDPVYRRLHYVRYADDFLLGFSGPKSEAEEVKLHLRDFLRDSLKLEMSEEKTLITHATSTAARFLGYEIKGQRRDDKIGSSGRRTVNGVMSLRVPQDVIDARCRRYMRNSKPIHRPELLYESDYSIVRKYQKEYRGMVQYYILAVNVSHLYKLNHVMLTSLLKTLAAKHKAHVTAMVRKYHATTTTPYGAMKCLKVIVAREGKPPLVAMFGGVPLRRKKIARIDDLPRYTVWTKRTDLLARLLADRCELCGYEGKCEVHHIRKLANLYKHGRKEMPEWMKRMIAMRRKTLVLCKPCHLATHSGTLSERMKATGEPDATKAARSVRRGADGKGP